MAEPTQPKITVRLVDDPSGDERAQQLQALLATGIERWLRARTTVDFGRDMSVHHDMDSDQPRW
ncbi:MAG: hypothetical protein CVU47_00135 [Chloroflexi bacterium HGW-Chloroflexi-9]|nr:MAG: hypothetical protein CVU47_00135 [Chloroflexi bacterium HGW-Chloroflexi-9]